MEQSRESLEAITLRAALALASRLGPGYALAGITARIVAPDGSELHLDVQLQSRASALPTPSREDWPALHLKRIHRQLLQAATSTPVPVKRLIALAGYPVHSTSRRSVTDLVRAGYLHRLPEGVRLGGRPVE